MELVDAAMMEMFLWPSLDGYVNAPNTARAKI